jgi:hypothetical protein
MQKQMSEKAKLRLMLTMAISLLTAACAPTFESHIDSMAMPASDSPQSATQCASAQKPAALDPPPQLPDTNQSPCPPNSGLAACFTQDQNAIRQKRFKILHDDRNYCRDAYNRARDRVSGKSHAD